MKKVLKVIGIVLAVIVALIIVLLIVLKILSGLPTPLKNYWEQVETGGEIEKKYLQYGAYETSYYEERTMQWFEKYEIHYPTEMESENNKYPVIVVCNGTGMTASKSKYILDHYASWGFIVIGNEETYSWNAFGAEMAIRHLQLLNDTPIINDKENIFYQKIDFDNVGIVGHSQGGVGVFNAITNTDHKDIYKTAVSLSPTNKELAAAIEWPYDVTKIDIPIMLVSGAGGGDDLVVTLEGLTDIYNEIPSDKLMVRRKDTAHGLTGYAENGYVIAWFMWQLQGDEEAAKAFVGKDAEILNNEFYQNQQVHMDTACVE